MSVLQVPLFEESAPAYGVEGNMLLLTNSASTYRAAQRGAPEELTAAADGARSALLIDARSAAGHLAQYFRILAQRDNWRSSGNAVFFWRNAGSLFESLDFLEKVTLVRSSDGDFEKEKVYYSFAR
jgi:hypothetical protein